MGAFIVVTRTVLCSLICSHVIATAHVDGELRSFLDAVNGVCKLNLTAIAHQGMPSGAGRKGELAKRKCSRKCPATKTRSVRPCFRGSNQSSTELLCSSIGNVQTLSCPPSSTSATFSPSLHGLLSSYHS